MFRNMVANLIAHESIDTTVAKAKEVRRIAERIITKARRLGEDVNREGLTGAAAARRLAVKRDVASFLPAFAERHTAEGPERIDVVEHLFREIAPRFLNRPGGYTRIVRLGPRRGDGAEMAKLSFVKEEAAPSVAAVRASAPKASE